MEIKDFRFEKEVVSMNIEDAIAVGVGKYIESKNSRRILVSTPSIRAWHIRNYALMTMDEVKKYYEEESTECSD